jgi:hypothetical protein
VNVARMGERRGAHRSLVRKPEREREHLGDPSAYGKIILNRSSGSEMWVPGLDRAGSG